MAPLLGLVLRLNGSQSEHTTIERSDIDFGRQGRVFSYNTRIQFRKEATHTSTLFYITPKPPQPGDQQHSWLDVRRRNKRGA